MIQARTSSIDGEENLRVRSPGELRGSVQRRSLCHRRQRLCVDVRYLTPLDFSRMAETNQSSRNWTPLLALLVALAAFFSNLAVFLRPPGERAIPLLSLVLAAVALILVVMGVRRAFAHNRGKILSSLVGVLALLVCGITGFAYFSARQLPKSAGAPKIGQKAPDFTLADSSGKQVSLAQLLGASAPAAGGTVENAASVQAAPAATGSARPKAVLLIFYRGYW